MKKDIYKIRFSDILLSILIIVLALSMYFFIYIKKHSSIGRQAIVTVNGKEYGNYSLDTDQMITIKTDNGFNCLKIENGTAKIVDADCPDKYCVNQNGISHKGEVIVCLPHKLTVQISDDNIEDNSSDNNIDAVVK